MKNECQFWLSLMYLWDKYPKELKLPVMDNLEWICKDIDPKIIISM